MAFPMEVDTPAPVRRSKAAKGKGKMDDSSLFQGPWVEKYRPKTLEDVAAHKDIVETSELRHTDLVGSEKDADMLCWRSVAS